MFYKMIHDWFRESEGIYNYFVDVLLLWDMDAMNEYMNRISPQIFSFFDTGKYSLNEELECFLMVLYLI